MNARQSALEILIEVFEHGRSLTSVLSRYDNNHQSALIKQYAFGVCRWYFQSRSFLQQLLTKKLKAKDYDIELLMLLGIYELSHMKSSEHAVVNECVNITKTLKKDWAAGLVNAVLRNFIRKKDQLNNNSNAHPKWLVKMLQRTWPNHWQEIINANNEHPPMTLRVNKRKMTAKEYLDRNDLQGNLDPVASEAIRLSTARSVNDLPGFHDGVVSIQDQSAQLAAHLLNLQPGLRVLDACAAPGGKTCHIAELERNLSKLTALDIDYDRAQLIQENLSRLQLEAEVIVANAAQPQDWWNNHLYDRILVDAPCSATGVIRRHPDIKFHRQAHDIEELTKQQLSILEALWPLLKPGGLMLYVTCSILPQENNDIIAQFLTKNNDAGEHKIELKIGYPQTYGLQLLPNVDAGDGFYFARLQKSIP